MQDVGYKTHFIYTLLTVCLQLTRSPKTLYSVFVWHVTRDLLSHLLVTRAYAVMQVSSPGRQCNHVSGLSIVSTLSTVHLHTLSTVCLHFPQTTALQSGGVNWIHLLMTCLQHVEQCVVRLVLSDSEIPVNIEAEDQTFIKINIRYIINHCLHLKLFHSLVELRWFLQVQLNVKKEWRILEEPYSQNVNWWWRIFSQCGCGSWCSVLHHSINNCQTPAATFGG